MIKISKIDDKLTVFKDKTIILYGAERRGREVKTILEKYGFNISYFCDHNSNKWGTDYEGVPVISPEKLQDIYDKNMIIQISSTADRSIQEQLTSEGMLNYISFEEFSMRMEQLAVYKMYTQPEYRQILNEYIESERTLFLTTVNKKLQKYAMNVKYLDLDSCNILCLPPKTGDITLNKSLFALYTRGMNLAHSYRNLTDSIKTLIGERKIKIVTAVRDVIAQNLSSVFQVFDDMQYEYSPCFRQEYWHDGGDVQALFDIYVPLWISFFNSTGSTMLIQDFFENAFEPYSHIDVYKYPFDKEQGYTIIDVEDQNTEVFIYQLEKLNDIKDELGRFLGVQNIELINNNVGEEKWYADAYKKAKKELKFSREYFDDCFNCKIMTHFYSDTDIEKFKQRWIGHVKD